MIKKILVSLALASAALGAQAEAISFDGLGSNGFIPFSGEYAGLTWDNFFTVSKDAYYGEYARGVVSGSHALSNANGASASFSRDIPFTLDSLLLTKVYFSGVTVIQGFNGADLVGTLQVTSEAGVPKLVEFGDWAGQALTKVAFSGDPNNSASSQVVIDGINLGSAAAVSPVPLLASGLLLGAGLLGMLGIQRRKRAACVTQ